MDTPFQTRVPRERRILIVREPDNQYPSKFLNQFGILLSARNMPGHRGIWHQDHPALPAYFRPTMRFRELMEVPVPAKRDGISVITSSKTSLPGHRQRLRFLRRLETRLNDRLVRFGRGFREIEDKADAILPYKYHLVLENSAIDAYWTEKLADAYLGYAFPIVWGPPDLGRWFPPDSFALVDITKFDRAIAEIVRIMDDGTYEKRLPAIREARERLMTNERLCPVLARVIAAHPSSVPQLAVPETIAPLPKPPPHAKVWREVRRLAAQVDAAVRR